jgi:SAM-dependent methyltransferase
MLPPFNGLMRTKNDFRARSKLREIGRWYVTRFVENAARSLPTGSLILDAGAGECAYKELFGNVRYLSIDVALGEPSWNYHDLDCIGALNTLPFKDQSFDAILCTQTLEHLEWPRESVREFFRVLGPAGVLYLTAPMAHHEHQAPYDFFRYTSFGLDSICRKAGFTRVQIVAFGGTFTRMAYEVSRVLSIFPGAGIRRGKLQLKGVLCLPIRAVLLIPTRLLQIILLGLDRFDRKRDYPFGWGVIARK